MNVSVMQDKYPQPDMSVVHNSLAIFNRAIAGQTFNVIPSLQERIQGAGRTLNAHTHELLNTLRRLEVAVANAGLNDIVSQWTVIADNTVIEEGVRAPALERIKTLYLQIVDRIMTIADNTQHSINLHCDEVTAINLDHYADPLLDYDAQRRTELESDNAGLQVELDQLKVDYAALQEAISLLESISVWDQVKGMVPTFVELQAAMTSAVSCAVDPALLKLAYERVMKYVNFFESSHQFSTLTDARTQVYEAMGKTTQAIKENTKTIDVFISRAEKLERHGELLEARSQWLATLSSVRQGVQKFTALCRLMNEATEEAIKQAPHQMAEFVKFARPLQ